MMLQGHSSQPRSEVKAEDSGNEDDDQNGGQAAKPSTLGYRTWMITGCSIQWLVTMGDNGE